MNKQQWINLRRKDALERSQRARQPAEWVVHEKPVREQELMESLAYPHSRVAAIGCFGDPHKDPAPWFMSTILKNKNLQLVDCIDGFAYAPNVHSIQLRLRKIIRERIKGQTNLSKELFNRVNALSEDQGETGQGGLEDYLAKLRQLTGKKKITIVPALAWRTGISKNSVHLVIDRGTWSFIDKQGPGKLEETLNHYLELLKDGSRIAYLGGPGRYGFFPNTLNRLLRKKVIEGIVRVEEVPLERKVPYKLSGLKYSGYDYTYAYVVTKLAQKRIKK